MKFDNYKIRDITLRKHQIETISFYFQHKRCFIFDDIGTGKTLESLAAMDFLELNKKIKRVLIVCPLSVMMSTWANHIFRYFPYRRFGILHGTKSKRLEELNRDLLFYIINIDGIKIIEKEIIKKKFDVLVIDESTHYSAHTSQRTKCAWRLAKSIPSIICLTGNPIPNNSIQSYAQAKLVNPYTAPKYFTRFRDEIKIKLDMYNYIDRDNAVEIAYSILQPAIRHTLEECNDIPDIIYTCRDIKLTPEQKKHYKNMEKEYICEINDGIITASNAGVKAIKLLQISAGLVINEEHKSITINHKHRLDELDLIFGQMRRKKLIIFAMFTHSVNALVDHFKGKAEKIDGSVSLKKRTDIINRFQNGDLEILVAQPASISHGVNLFAANVIIWWSVVFSNEVYIQCNGRIRRSGQTRKQLVIKFQSTSIERKIYKALESKQSVSKALLNMVEEET